MTKRITTLLVLSLLCVVAYAQNWTTIHGNNERNGISKIPGPQSVQTPLWTVTDASFSSSGINIYSFGDRIVNSRVVNSPNTALIECRDLTTGQLIWTSPNLGSEAILYLMGFNEDAVYAHDYNSDLFYSLSPVDGDIQWVAPKLSYTFARTDGIIFTCERNIIINSPVGGAEAIMCLDKETGAILWENSNLISVTPNNTKAAHGDKIYLVRGAFSQPVQLVAVDMNTGEDLYYSDELAGGSIQQQAISISPDGIIYVKRDAGDLIAIKDTGSGFNTLWSYTPVDMGFFVFNHSMDYDGNPLILDDGKVCRLNKADGSLMNSSQVDNISNGRISIDSDSVIFVNNYGGKYFALSYDLQTTLWEKSINNNFDAGPMLAKDGIMVLAGAGSTVTAYQYEGAHAPVSDFVSDRYKLDQFGSVNFSDQSSFQPTSWSWTFEGGTPATSTDQHPSGIQYETPGIYEVTLVTANDSGSDTLTKKCLIEVIMTTSTVEVNEMAVSVYPNPTAGIVNIDFPDVEQSQITVSDIVGRTIFQTDHLTDKQIDLSGFKSGVYVIRIQTEEGYLTRRIIKN